MAKFSSNENFTTLHVFNISNKLIKLNFATQKKIKLRIVCGTKHMSKPNFATPNSQIEFFL